MSLDTTNPSLRLFAKCTKELEELDFHNLYTLEEEELYHRIIRTSDPLAWQDQHDDDQTAILLWSKLQGLIKEEIQMSLFFTDLRNLDPVVATFSDGYI